MLLDALSGVREVLEGLLTGLVPALRDLGRGWHRWEVRGQRRRLYSKRPVSFVRLRDLGQPLLHSPDGGTGPDEQLGGREDLWRDTATK